jgi:hypothetical protein
LLKEKGGFSLGGFLEKGGFMAPNAANESIMAAGELVIAGDGLGGLVIAGDGLGGLAIAAGGLVIAGDGALLPGPPNTECAVGSFGGCGCIDRLLMTKASVNINIVIMNDNKQEKNNHKNDYDSETDNVEK